MKWRKAQFIDLTSAKITLVVSEEAEWRIVDFATDRGFLGYFIGSKSLIHLANIFAGAGIDYGTPVGTARRKKDGTSVENRVGDIQVEINEIEPCASTKVPGGLEACYDMHGTLQIKLMWSEDDIECMSYNGPHLILWGQE